VNFINRKSRRAELKLHRVPMEYLAKVSEEVNNERRKEMYKIQITDPYITKLKKRIERG